VSKASEDSCPVYRGSRGDTHTLSTEDLMVGDLIQLMEGNRVPADCILIDSTDFATDESPLTGEPEQVEKSCVTEANYKYNPNPFLYGKTLIVNGQGIAIVCTVGTHTRSGMAEEKLNIEEEETPLQQKLETIANEIGKIGVYVAILTFLAMTVNLVIKTLMADKELFTVGNLSHLVNYLIIGITVIVVAVPEGLPLAVTISLAFSVMKMKKENNLVRKLEASETMGGANEICTDKTGTLTQNKMTVKAFYTMETTFESIPKNLSNIKTAQLLHEGVLFNCSARVEIDEGKFVPKGNCTEVGLINFLQDV
jgi:Ca2+ transporting ATPase